jgi:hypothetical protein
MNRNSTLPDPQQATCNALPPGLPMTPSSRPTIREDTEAMVGHLGPGAGGDRAGDLQLLAAVMPSPRPG